MANLAEDRITELSGLPGKSIHIGIKAAKKAYLGVLALVDADGYYNPDAGVSCAGIVADYPTGGNRGDNTYSGATDGGEEICASYHERRTFDLDGDATPTNAHIGKPVFAKDNHTLSLEPFAATGVRPYVGLFAGRDGDQGRVDLDLKANVSPEDLGDYLAAPEQELTVADAPVINSFQKVYTLTGDPGAVILAVDFPDGYTGQKIRVVGGDDAKTITIPTGIHTLTAGGVSLVLNTKTFGEFVFDGSVWQETARSANA